MAVSLRITIDSKWKAKEDENLVVVVLDVNLSHVLIEVIGSTTTPRGCIQSKPHRDMMTHNRFIKTFDCIDDISI